MKSGMHHHFDEIVKAQTLSSTDSENKWRMRRLDLQEAQIKNQKKINF